MGSKAAQNGSLLLTFWDNLSVPSLGVKLDLQRSMLQKIPEECRSNLFCSRSLKLCSLNELGDKLCGTEV
jgi:hypothetical protein